MGLISSLIKILVAPGIGFLVANMLGLGWDERRIALIFLACPTAAASYVMTEQLGGDNKLAATTVVISSLLSVISLSLVVGFF